MGEKYHQCPPTPAFSAKRPTPYTLWAGFTYVMGVVVNFAGALKSRQAGKGEVFKLPVILTDAPSIIAVPCGSWRAARGMMDPLRYAGTHPYREIFKAAVRPRMGQQLLLYSVQGTASPKWEFHVMAPLYPNHHGLES